MLIKNLRTAFAVVCALGSLGLAGTAFADPEQPILTGPTAVTQDVPEPYQFTVNDPTGASGDSISYLVDWGDATATTGIAFSPSIQSVTKTWHTVGTFDARVRLTNLRTGQSSPWSLPLQVTVSAPPQDHPPSIPTMPSGLTCGFPHFRYTYSSSSTDPDGDPIWYTFEWGDGTQTSNILAASGEPVQASHRWSAPGIYAVRVRAQMTTPPYALTDWSPALQVTIKHFPHHAVPAAPVGPASGVGNVSHAYRARTTALEGNAIRYTFDWGDGTTTRSTWVSPSAPVSIAHAWRLPGTYAVRVRVTDSQGAQSPWSAPTRVAISACVRSPDKNR